jgi:hypothetical protein
MKTYIHLWQYLAELFLEREIFQTILQRKPKHIFYVQYLISENHAVYEIM